MTAPRVVLGDDDFSRLRALLARVAGLDVQDSRRTSLACSLAERMRRTGTSTVSSYLDLVSGDGAAAELQELLDEVTIQETHFFRNPPQTRALREHILPELVRAAAGRDRRLRIWSAGCSTGEEPYTVAMVLRELLPSTAGWDVKVVATDISQRALTAAREGVYGSRAVQATSAADLGRFFLPAGEGRVRVRQDVRELVEFRHHNLITERPPFRQGDRIDLVLCRNVTIYFARDTTRALMGRLHTVLRDGGYLLLGHAETLWQLSDDFELVVLGAGRGSAFVYRRRDGKQPAALPAAARPERRAPAVPPARPEPAPLDPVPGIRRALAHGRYDEAALLAAEAVDAAPLRAEGHYLHGLALVEGRRDEDALPALRRAVYLDPEAGLAHFLLAGVLARLGHDVAAAREYRAAASTLGRSPRDASAAELGGRRVEELATLCESLADALSLTPDRPA